ncbi:MAG: transcriptional repressor [Planctomycetes bacterium]|jgi:Fur family ferric uptake transcriptional regulator|nr:transcriptional repressor [Planctomycetota bacterium]
MSRSKQQTLSPEDLADAWQQFKTFLRERGARITETRRIVLERALQRADHFRADQLAGELAQGSDRVSRGTVYRTLALLVEIGLLREIRDTDTHVHYEATVGREHHEHMVCDGCGAFIEFDDARVGRQLAAACREKGFEQRTHRVVIFGRCRRCRNDEAARGSDRGTMREQPI